MDEKKEIGSESDTKSGAGKEIMGALSQFDQLMVLILFRKKKNTHGAIRLFTFVSFFYVKCKEETNMLYCVCDLYEFERLAKNSRIPTFFFLFLF